MTYVIKLSLVSLVSITTKQVSFACFWKIASSYVVFFFNFLDITRTGADILYFLSFVFRKNSIISAISLTTWACFFLRILVDLPSYSSKWNAGKSLYVTHRFLACNSIRCVQLNHEYSWLRWSIFFMLYVYYWPNTVNIVFKWYSYVV